MSETPPTPPAAPPPPPGAYLPQPPLNPQDEKTWSVLIHLSGLILGFIGPLVGYLVLKDRGPFIRWHTTQALNFQLSVLIYTVGVIIVAFVTLGIGAVLALPFSIAVVVFMIIAAVQANGGQYYRYPLTIQFLR